MARLAQKNARNKMLPVIIFIDDSRFTVKNTKSDLDGLWSYNNFSQLRLKYLEHAFG